MGSIFTVASMPGLAQMTAFYLQSQGRRHKLLMNQLGNRVETVGSDYAVLAPKWSVLDFIGGFSRHVRRIG